MELAVQLQEPGLFRFEPNSLVWDQILYHMSVNERIKLRQVCRLWRHIVDYFKADRLVVFVPEPHGSSFPFKKHLNMHDLFPFYTRQRNEPDSRDETTCNYPLRPKQPEFCETFTSKKIGDLDNGTAKFNFPASKNNFKSIVSHFGIGPALIFDIPSNPFVECLEFYVYSGNNSFDLFDNTKTYIKVITEFDGLLLPRLRRLVLYRCVVLYVFRRCPELQVLKVDEFMQFGFFKEIEWLRDNNQVSSLKKLRFRFNLRANDYNFFVEFVSLNALETLPDLEKLTLMLDY